jgi:phosphoribosylglycinamide formyltransferase 1
MKKIVILISPTGKGTNLHAILEAIKTGDIHARVAAVLSETASAPGVEIAERYSVSWELCRTKNDLLPILTRLEPDFIVLCGWKQIIPDAVLSAYKNKILNLHPGVIPETPDTSFPNPDGSDGLWNKGLYADLAIENFLKKGSSYAGSSVHFLTNEFDFGPVLGRTFERIHPHDTIESLYARLKKKEHLLYVEVLANLCNKAKSEGLRAKSE